MSHQRTLQIPAIVDDPIEGHRRDVHSPGESGHGERLRTQLVDERDRGGDDGLAIEAGRSSRPASRFF